MANSKQKKKKKERERRVAQKKLATTVKRRDLEKSSEEPEVEGPEWTKLITKVFPKTGSASNKKKTRHAVE